MPDTFKTSTLREKEMRLDYGSLELQKFKPGVKQLERRLKIDKSRQE
jgi:hypothetical protein